MARGRMISNAIAQDKKISQLVDDTSRLAYTWLITFADAEGRTPGDPAVVRSMLFPRREDITIAQMTGYIKQWDELGLVVWYEAKDDMWICFPAFFNHNKIDATREAVSKIPAPPPDKLMTNSVLTPEQLASNSGVTHEQLPIKLIKVKLNQVNLNQVNPGDDDNLFKVYSDNISPLTQVISEKLKLLESDYGVAVVIGAVKKACEYNHRNLAYIEGILRNGKSGKVKRGDHSSTAEARSKYAEMP